MTSISIIAHFHGAVLDYVLTSSREQAKTSVNSVVFWVRWRSCVVSVRPRRPPRSALRNRLAADPDH